jgi:hypothetical protein
VAAQLAAFKEVLSSMELASLFSGTHSYHPPKILSRATTELHMVLIFMFKQNMLFRVGLLPFSSEPFVFSAAVL